MIGGDTGVGVLVGDDTGVRYVVDTDVLTIASLIGLSRGAGGDSLLVGLTVISEILIEFGNRGVFDVE